MRTCTLLVATATLLAAAPVHEETVTFGRFGTVTLYSTHEHPRMVVLFVSGDGGWNQGVVDMARELASLDALVAGVNIVHYLRQLAASHEACSYPAADFEALSQFLQQRKGFPKYVTPLLVGYSSGATLVYTSLVQAPENTFRGAISLGFCAELPLSKPMCKGQGLEAEPITKPKGYRFLPSKSLERPWVALQGTIDKVCDPAATEKYVAQVPRGKIVVLPKVGHGYSVPRNWMPQFRAAFHSFEEDDPNANPPPPVALDGLPVVEAPAADPVADWFAVILSGDGGWSFLEKGLTEYFTTHGVSVAGLNSLHYFWNPKQPEGMSRDFTRLLEHYLSAWHKQRVAVIGYSMGADVAPFMLSRLPPELAGRVSLLTLLGPGPEIHFEFHFADWLGDSAEKGGHAVLPELRKLKSTRLLCVEGTEESDSLCPQVEGIGGRVLRLSGGHHFGGDYAAIARDVAAAMESR